MLNFLMSRPIWQKLMVLFLGVGIIPLLVVSYQSVLLSSDALFARAGNTLEGLRDAKAKSVQDYFANRRSEISLLATAPQVIKLAGQMKSSFHSVVQDNAVDEAQLARFRTGVESYYRDQFGQEYQKRMAKAADMSMALSSLTPESTLLQYFYIQNNANPLGSKHLLDVASDSSGYSRQHSQLHGFLRSAVAAFGYYDIFLIDPDSGDVFYTVFKELDFATNLKNGAWAQTGLGKVYRAALALDKPGSSVLVDFERYRPSYDDPASFMAAPVYSDGKRVAIVALQLPLEPMNAIMNDRSGLGETGETFLVGPDHLMRSDSVLFADRFAVKTSFAHPDQGRVDLPIVKTAFDERVELNRGVTESFDLGGNPSIAAYAPIDLGEFNWAIVSVQPTKEAMAAVNAIKQGNQTIGIVSAVLIVLVAFVLGKGLSAPIVALRNYIVRVEKTAELQPQGIKVFGDEIGQTVTAFESMLHSLQHAFVDVTSSLEKVAAGQYEMTAVDQYNGDIKRLAQGVNVTVDQLQVSTQQQRSQQEALAAAARDMEQKARETEQLAAQAAEEADRANRIKQALDACSTPVMMADDTHQIIYTNGAMQGLVQKYEADFRKVFSGFDRARLIGTNMDMFHRNPAQQRTAMSQSTGPRQAEEILAGKTLRVTASPVLKDGKWVGTVVEWLDRTDEVSIEQAVDEMISAVAQGDFSSSIDEQGKEGFFLRLSEGLNAMVGTSSAALQDIMHVMNQLAKGNLTTHIEKQYQGLFGQLRNDVNLTIDRLSQVVGEILESSTAISNGASEIESGVMDLSRRTEKAAAALEETAASMDEMTASVKNSAQHAATVLQLSAQAEAHAEEGSAVMERVIQSMHGINKSSNQIADIISVIDEIAFQTNLLALNAAVEAARAGEQGRGFSVVASEVRKLAQRSAGAAKEIKELINESVGKVSSGSVLVDESGKRLHDIRTAVGRVAGAIREIATAASEQATGISQVNVAIGQMDESTQQNSALVEQATAAAESMAVQSRSMAETVRFFQVR